MLADVQEDSSQTHSLAFLNVLIYIFLLLESEANIDNRYNVILMLNAILNIIHYIHSSER